MKGYSGTKRKTPYQKKTPYSKGSYKKKTKYTKSSGSGYSKDFTKHLFNGYCEILHKRSPGADATDHLSLSIPCDVSKVWKISQHLDTKAAIDGASSGVLMLKGDATETILTPAQAKLTLPNFMYHKNAWHLMRIDFVKIKITLPASNLDHCIIMSTDRGDETLIASTQQAITGAHTSYLPGTDRRQFTYTWKPKDTQDREWISTNASRADTMINYIKIFQKLEPKSDNKQVAVGTGGAGFTGEVMQLLAGTLSTTAIETCYAVSFRDSKTRADGVVTNQGNALN